jgi:asparagine synthase (glutamine-hydrolysing)
MPGITGIIRRKTGPENEMECKTMMNCMMHEPFYTSNSYINHDIGVCLGWVGKEGSFSDCMPGFSEDRERVLMFTGEDFSGFDKVDELKGKGHRFQPGNASHIVHCYEEEGEEFLTNLNGWFSGVLIDREKGLVMLFNDRYGMQQVYYHESDEGFFFSSEAKSLLKIKPHLRNMDMENLGQLLLNGFVLNNKTIFRGIGLLPGGSSWKFRDGGVEKKEQYFHATDLENQPELGKENFYKKFRSTFMDILPRYFSPAEPVGMSLTGGLDTRMIMANMDFPPGGMPCYTYGGMYRDCLDVKIAREVAKTCHQSHDLLPLGDDYLGCFPDYAEKTVYYTDGVLDVCGSHELYLSRLARKIAPIRMTGNYGGEVLRNVDYVKPNPSINKVLNPDFHGSIVEAEKSFSETRHGHALSYSLCNLIPWQLHGRLVSANSQLTLRTPYMDNDLVRILYQAPEDVRKSKEISLRLIADGNPALLKIPTDRGLYGNRDPVSSMVTRLYNEFLFKAEYYYNSGMPDWLAKFNSVFGSLNPESYFNGIHKIENYRLWFKNELSEYVREILLDQKTKNRSYLNSAAVEKIVLSHEKGFENHTDEINKLLSVELIQRTLVEAN